MTSPTPNQSADERSLSAGQHADPQRSDAKPARGETRRLSLSLSLSLSLFKAGAILEPLPGAFLIACSKKRTSRSMP